MIAEYKAIYEGGQGELVEKKSRFIANVESIETEEEAQDYIEKIKKKYWDARHNCFAYVLGERHETARFSDDGEPGGTAGKPMLDVLLGEDVHNVVVVVTRYFGGTLLGTGGLVRAYSGATKEGLKNSVIITKISGTQLSIETDYTGLGKIQYILGEQKITIMDSVYTDKVELIAMVPTEKLGQIKSALIEGTNARATLTEGNTCYFANIEGEIVIF